MTIWSFGINSTFKSFWVDELPAFTFFIYFTVVFQFLTLIKCTHVLRSKRCTSKFATASELEGHLLEKHRKFQPIKVYETCDQCGLELKNAKDKERHIRKHLTEEFDCSQLWRCRADSDCERVCESAKSSFKNTILLIN